MAHQISHPNSIVDNFFIKKQNHDMFMETCAGKKRTPKICSMT